MQGFASLLVAEAGKALGETGKDYANRINVGSQTMDHLLVDLLDFSRISMHQMELSPVSLEAVIRSTLAQLQTEIQQRRARVETDGPWPMVLAHEPTLGQVLMNLIANAIKFVAP